jgi:hypothetical protein
MDLFIIQNGGTLSSNQVALEAICSSVGTMSGSVTGNQLNILVSGNNEDTVSIAGTASAGSFTGSYTSQNVGMRSERRNRTEVDPSRGERVLDRLDTIHAIYRQYNFHGESFGG